LSSDLQDCPKKCALAIYKRSNKLGFFYTGFILRGGLIFLKGKLWLNDAYRTFKSCAGVVLVGLTVAGAMIFIRLLGERRFERVITVIFFFRRKAKDKKLSSDPFVVDN
jgi:hypothetical protein